MEEKDVKEAPVEQTEKTSKKKKANPIAIAAAIIVALAFIAVFILH